MASALTFIASATLAGNVVVTFSSIPQSYKDLIIVFRGRVNSSSTDTVAIRPNSDGNALYSYNYLLSSSASEGSTASVTSGYATSEIYWRGGVIPGNTSAVGESWSNDEYHIFDYTNSSYFKVMGSQCGYVKGRTEMRSHLYRGTSAITSLTFGTASGSSFAYGSRAVLYGIG